MSLLLLAAAWVGMCLTVPVGVSMAVLWFTDRSRRGVHAARGWSA